MHVDKAQMRRSICSDHAIHAPSPHGTNCTRARQQQGPSIKEHALIMHKLCSPAKYVATTVPLPDKEFTKHEPHTRVNQTVHRHQNGNGKFSFCWRNFVPSKNWWRQQAVDAELRRKPNGSPCQHSKETLLSFSFSKRNDKY